jgi:hypothetical protein
MPKNLLCALGLHRWRRKKAEGGGWYKECGRCGKFKDVGAPPPGILP